MIELLNGLISALGDSLTGLLSLLPMSPFIFTHQLDNQWLRAINLIFPLDWMLTFLSYYLAAVLVYYAYRIIFRWAKIAGS